jgi:vancomycin resistance protein YoaR
LKRCYYVVAILVTFFVLNCFAVLKPLLDEKVYAGVTLDGVQLSGLTATEVKDLLRLWYEPKNSQHLSAYYGEQAFSFDSQTVDYDVDVEATADAVMHCGRTGNVWERLKYIHLAQTVGYQIPLKVRYNEQKLAELIESWRESIDKPPRNAGFSILHGGMIQAESGRRLETTAVTPLVLQALEQAKEYAVALPVTPLYPEMSEADIASIGLKELLANYTTTFNTGDGNRSANIRIAASKINGYIIYPSQTFSFNDVVGPRDKEHGFKEAMEIVGNEYVPGIGGGICQVSSTLYNVALLANLPIAERYNHSKPLGYVGLGRDATVAYGTLDFKFTNNTAGPVMIISEIQDNQLCVGLFGTMKSSSGRVKVITVNKQVILPTDIRQQDPTLWLGETELAKQGKSGYEVTTVRVLMQGDKEVKREIIATDQYLPENRVVKIGTKLPDFLAGNN